MSDPYCGEIRMFGGNFAPVGWLLCQGQLLSISDNEMLFNLIGTTYGGDGQTTFGLPNLAGRVPVHAGQSGTYPLGAAGGVEEVTLGANQLGSHSHVLAATTTPGTTNIPAADTALATMGPDTVTNVYTWYPYDGTSQQGMSPASISPAGGGLPHPNIQPTVAINYIIALSGVYPSQG